MQGTCTGWAWVEKWLCYLVRLPDVGEVEASGAVGRVGGHAGHAALVALPAVGWVALVPDVDRDVLSLHTHAAITTGNSWRDSISTTHHHYTTAKAFSIPYQHYVLRLPSNRTLIPAQAVVV